MITKKVIDALYRKYDRRPDSPDELNLGLVFDFLMENHFIEINEKTMVINSLDSKSPFRVIPLRHIHAIVEFGDDVAIVLHSSIIILSKHDRRVNVHLKKLSHSLKDFFRLGAAL